MIAWIAGWLTAAMELTGATGVFLAMALESACVPLPSEIVLPFTGIMVTHGVFSFRAAVFWAMAGQMAGSYLAHCAGKYGGRPFIKRYGKYIFMRSHELDLAQGWFDRHGEVTAFATRLLPGVRTFISLPAGIARMPVGRFLVYSFLGALPWTMALIWAGVKTGKVWENPRWEPYFAAAEIAVLILLAGFVVHYLWFRSRGGDRGSR
jgi:membrane protein DedA with SNARE-associated domain